MCDTVDQPHLLRMPTHILIPHIKTLSEVSIRYRSRKLEGDWLDCDYSITGYSGH